MKNRKIALLVVIVLLGTMLTSCSAQTDSFLDTIFSVFPENWGVRDFFDNFEFTTFCVKALDRFFDQVSATLDTIAATDFTSPTAILWMIVQIPLWFILLVGILLLVIVSAVIDFIVAVVVSVVVPVMVIIVCVIYVLVFIINVLIG